MFEQETAPTVFLTNRFNLLEILSSGLVTPRAAFGKYYRDLLDAAQGRIPLLQAPLSPDLCARVSSGDPSSFPVAVEIDPTKLASTPVTALRNDGATEATSVGRSGARIWAAGGAIPSVALRKVHFRSAAELEEHKLREYDNILPGWLQLAVTPELFEKGAWAADDVEKWLASLAPVVAPSADKFAQYDRLAGARCLAAHAASAESLPGLAVFLGAASASSNVGANAFPPWLSADNTIRPRESGWRGKSTEERLYCSAVSVLRRVNPAEAWRPLDVLAAVQAAVATTHLPKKDETQLSKQFAAIGAILRNERAFKPFRSGVGNPVIKGLLMVLMRPEAARLLSWPASETGADHEVLLTAAVLAGVLHGHKRLNTDFRRPEVDRLIALTSARDICEGLRDAFRPADQVKLAVTTEAADSGGETVVLTWNGARVLTRQRRHRVLADLVNTLDLRDSEVSRALAEICVEQGWKECVRSVVTTTDRNWSVAPRSDGSTFDILVQGSVSVRLEVEMEALRQRLAQASLSAEEEEGMSSRLRAVGGRRGTAQAGPEPGGSSIPEPVSREPTRQPSTQHPRELTNG